MKPRTAALFLFVFVLGFAGGFLLFKLFNQRPGQQLTANTNCSYKYINPKRCDQDVTKNTKEYTTLRNNLLSYINGEESKGNVKVISVYFHDLVSDNIMSINAQETFAPASLLKVPLLMMYYKKAENDPNALNEKILVNGNLTIKKQDIEPQKMALPGQTYTVNDLLNLMITQSDNASWAVLLDDLNKNNSMNDFVLTLGDLGIIDPSKASQEQYITTQAYASVFRTLYEASYLNPDMSERALKLLSGVIYKDGIVAGLPGGTATSHKFGEEITADNSVQLHDCGIVYYKPDPYLICVMTQGSSISNLQPIIQTVSKQIFDEVQKRNE